MSEHDLVPGADADFDTFQAKIITEVTTNATAWSIPTDDITPVTTAQGDWTEAWAIAKNKNDCTTAETKAKDVAREDLEEVLRPFIQRYLYLNPAVTASDRSKMGLKEHSTTRTPVSDPDTVPVMEYKAATGHQLKCYYHQEADTDGVSRRGKPDGVSRIEIIYAIGITPAPAAKDCTVLVSGTRSPVTIPFDAADTGKTIVLYARWVSTRNEPGPWNEGTVTNVP